MTPKSRLVALEKLIEATQTELRRQRRLSTPFVIFDDPEGDLDRFRLPDWVLSTLGTIELGRPGGIEGEPESQAEWVARLTRDAEGILRAKASPEDGPAG
jgi:hypothetical protein